MHAVSSAATRFAASQVFHTKYVIYHARKHTTLTCRLWERVIKGLLNRDMDAATDGRQQLDTLREQLQQQYRSTQRISAPQFFCQREVSLDSVSLEPTFVLQTSVQPKQ